MQETRRLILEVLRSRGEATVDEVVIALTERINHDITAVTIRHHLDILRSEDLVTAPVARRRNSPGRPQHVYALTEKALEYFPNNYQNLASNLLHQIKETLPPAQVNVILEQIADHMVAGANIQTETLESRLESATHYLNQHGYEAAWEACPEGYILKTRNCPYHGIAGQHQELCGLDARLITGLVGIVPRRLDRVIDSGESCAYLFPVKQNASVNGVH
jgi:DeoR family transcriptional regulator, suf operon transcriptional repressor